MTDQITTPIGASEIGTTVHTRALAIHDFWLGASARSGESTMQGSYSRLSGLLSGTPLSGNLCGMLRADYLPRLNLLNTPPDLVFARLFGNGENGRFSAALAQTFSDTAGTVPAVFGTQQVARVNSRTPAGASWQQAAAAAQPGFGRAPLSVRNRANGSAAPANNTFWPATDSGNGVTVTRVATGSDVDGPWAEYTVVGTATADSFLSFYAEASRTPSAVGQTWTASFRAWRVAGAAPPAGSGVQASVAEETATSTPLAFTTSAVFAGTDPTMLTATRTLNQAGVNQTRAGVVIITHSGATVDYTIRVQAVQFEQGSARTAYQANVSQFDITESGFPAFPFARFDLSDDALATTIATGGTFDVLVPGRVSTRIARGLSIGNGQELRIGPTSLNVAGSPVGMVGLLAATGDLVDLPLVVNRTITAAELTLLMTYYSARGAGALVE